jgi:hypothetical protein
MTAPAIVTGKSTVLACGASTIDALVSIDSSDIASSDEVDTTTLSSTYKTNRPELPDPGETSFKIYFDGLGTVHALLIGKAQTPTAETWTLTFSNSDSFSCTAWVKSFKLSGMKIGGNVEGDLTLRHETSWA